MAGDFGSSRIHCSHDVAMKNAAESIRMHDLVSVLHSVELREDLCWDEVRALALLAMRVARLRRDRDPSALSIEAKAGVIMKLCLIKRGPWEQSDDVFGGGDSAKEVIFHAMPKWRRFLVNVNEKSL